MKNKILLIVITAVVSTQLFAQKSAANLDRSKPPQPAAAPVIKLGNTQSFELANGLKVFVVENHKLPKVAYSFVFNVHPGLENEAVGVSQVTGELMTSGTKKRSKDQLDGDIDFIGATVNTSAQNVYAASLKKQQEALLDILSDIILNPDFKQEELEKIKMQTISGLETQKDDPDAIAQNIKSVLNFSKAHPYGEIATEQSILNVTLEKCNTYYKTYFRPNVAYLAVVGDITVSEIKPLIEKYFSAWQKAEVPASNFATPAAPAKTRVALVNKSGAVQSIINVTYPVDLKPNNPDVIKVKVLNTILGGGMSSRLFENLREKHGYTYGSYSALNSDELVAEFTAFAKVRNSVTDSALTELVNELNRIRNEKVTQEELTGIKNYLTGNFAIALEDPATVARFAINTERYHLPKDYYQNYLKTLAAVTVDDIYAMAQKYIRPNNATILVVGDKKELAKKLESFTPLQPLELYDNYGNTVVDTSKPIAETVTVKTVIESYLTAIGGRKAIAEVKDVSTKMNAKLQGMEINISTFQKTPNKYAMAIKMGPMVVQKEVYDGVKGMQSSPQGKSELTGDGLEQMKLQATLFVEMHYEKMGYKLVLDGTENINGKDCYKLNVTSPKGQKITEYYDRETGLKCRSVLTSKTENGPVSQISDITDYKEVNGVKFPASITVSGAMSMKLAAESIEVNKGVSDSEFKLE